MANPDDKNHTHHHILPYKWIFGVGGTLIFLTFVTVGIAHVDLGRLNFVVAVAVATVKASMVALIFMNLWFDKKENGVIFATSFLFLAIFLVLTATDLFFRGDVYVKGPLTAPEVKGKSKYKDPWVSSPELVARGKELFPVQCAACHGPVGKGDGPAAGALNPPPRNFTVTTGWKNGRKVSGVFKTLKEGVPGSSMASFATMPSDDRWALTHYVLSLGGPVEKDTPEDFKKAGVDTAGGGEAEEKVIPIDLAMDRMAVPEPGGAPARLYGGAAAPGGEDQANTGARIYNAQCVRCHGADGQGGIKVKNLGVWPTAYLTTRPFSAYASMGSQESFNRIVIQGIPGEVMPGNGQLSGGELRDLYQFVRNLKPGR